mgnify:CR=1 FL=1
MATHEVKIKIGKRNRFTYDKPRLLVGRGDTIKWKLKNNLPYGIIIKAAISPLNWSSKTATAGKWIAARVRRNAKPGRYLYGVGALRLRRLLFDDPEIIVRDPSRP